MAYMLYQIYVISEIKLNLEMFQSGGSQQCCSKSFSLSIIPRLRLNDFFQFNGIIIFLVPHDGYVLLTKIFNLVIIFLL